LFYTDRKDEVFALALGADKFVRKPVEPDTFIEIVEVVIREMETSKVVQKKAAGGREGEGVFKLYSERLVNKLEKKMLALEEEVARRKQVEKQLKVRLTERETLLRELHHRVKNNLQVVSSLLDMSSLRTQDENVIGLIKNVRSKIHSIAIVHSQLYNTEVLEQVNIGDYIHELVSYLIDIYARGEQITTLVEAASVHLDLAQAIPYALVLSELTSNAIRHAFNGREEGMIKISVEMTAGGTILTSVKDDGIGLSPKVDIAKVETLGLKLVRNVVQRQLKGKMRIKRDRGTEFIVEFKLLGKEVKYV